MSRLANSRHLRPPTKLSKEQSNFSIRKGEAGRKLDQDTAQLLIKPRNLIDKCCQLVVDFDQTPLMSDLLRHLDRKAKVSWNRVSPTLIRGSAVWPIK